MANQEWDAAHRTLMNGAECGYLPAKLELARLYRDCSVLGIPQHERYMKSEFYFRSIMNLLDISDADTGAICLDLAVLYSYTKRPVGMVAMLLRGKRYGARIPESDVDQARRLLASLDIHEFGKNARDAYDLAIELSLVGTNARLTEFLLREAAETDNQIIRGKACLALAEFYHEHDENPVYASEAARYYRLAAESGYPEYLSRRGTMV